MHISELHQSDKDLSVVRVAMDLSGTLLSIKLAKDAILNKHLSEVPAFLICVSGKVSYEAGNGNSQVLGPGDYVNIPAHAEHWLVAEEESQMLLVK